MKCDFCGKELEARIVNVAGNLCTLGYQECDCYGAESARKAVRDKERREAEQRAEYEFTKALRGSGIPERYAKAELTDRTRHLYDIAMEKGLYLYGEKGRGKTYTASAIGIQAIRDKNSVRMVKAHRIGDMLKYGSMDDALHLLVTPKLLIIDDIGADNTSEWAVSRLRAVIDERYDSMKPTVFTSNYSTQELERELDQGDKTAGAIISRIREMAKPLHMQGKDWRENL